VFAGSSSHDPRGEFGAVGRAVQSISVADFCWFPVSLTAREGKTVVEPRYVGLARDVASRNFRVGVDELFAGLGHGDSCASNLGSSKRYGTASEL